MNSVTQQVAANSEEAAAAAEELSSQADGMLEMIGRFSITSVGRAPVARGGAPQRAKPSPRLAQGAARTPGMPVPSVPSVTGPTRGAVAIPFEDDDAATLQEF
jgi:hypothetical protein